MIIILLLLNSILFFILYDNHTSHADISVTLTPEFLVVREDIGSVTLCLNVTAPVPDDPLDIEIFIDLETVPGTAGNVHNIRQHTISEFPIVAKLSPHSISHLHILQHVLGHAFIPLLLPSIKIG